MIILSRKRNSCYFYIRKVIASLLIGSDEFCREKRKVSGGSIMPNRINKLKEFFHNRGDYTMEGIPIPKLLLQHHFINGLILT